jgi:hypothetical protein
MPRTSSDETFLWKLRSSDPKDPDWLVVDIAGEQVSNPQFAFEALRGNPVSNLILMALAHADALKITIDGKKLLAELNPDPGRPVLPGQSVDSQYASIINQLGGLIPRLRAWKKSNRMDMSSEDMLNELRRSYADGFGLERNGGDRKISLPVLLLITKADLLFSLEDDKAVDMDALKYAAKHLQLTVEQARRSLSLHRWQFCAPFYKQPELEQQMEAPQAATVPWDGKPMTEEERQAEALKRTQLIDLKLPSYGVQAALEWLEAETGNPRPLRLPTEQAEDPIKRWSPWA